jgi:hypothetical protein
VTGKDEAIHQSRRGRNTVLGLILGGFVVLAFAVTVVKLSQGGEIVGFDHTPETMVAKP